MCPFVQPSVPFQKGLAAAEATTAGYGGRGGGGEGGQGQDHPVRRGAEGDEVPHEGGGGHQRIERRHAATLPPSEDECMICNVTLCAGHHRVDIRL